MRTLLAVSCLLLSSAAWADDPPAPSGDHTHCRAGYPMCIAPWARPGVSPKATGGLIGGGTKRRAAGPSPADGTWGWDYVGCLKPSRLFLGWDYARKHSAPAGPYKVDGPHVTDVFAVKPVRRTVEKVHEVRRGDAEH